MFEICPSINIEAPPDTVWEFLTEIEEWWVPSNPEHGSLEVLSDHDTLQEGTRIRVKERIAGLPGVAEGEITELRPREQITWEAPNTRYRYRGFTIRVDEDVSWKLDSVNGETELTAHVWAVFPDTLLGMLVEWSFKHLLGGVEKDYAHAMKELEYVKTEIESFRAGC